MTPTKTPVFRLRLPRSGSSPVQEARARTADLTWLRYLLLSVITAILLVPIGVVVLLAFKPNVGKGITLENFRFVFGHTDVLIWLANSLQVSLATVLISVLVGAPAGYVLARGTGRIVRGYALLLFVVQALPVITAVIPLFILFAKLHLVDTLSGVTIVYVGSSAAVATWMMAAYISTVPRSLEEAAWVDGCSVMGSFLRIVLRNALPGILSTAVFTFLLSWNDYLVATVFLRSSNAFTLPVGVESFFSQHATNWGAVMGTAVVMLIPPVLVFSLLHRFFSVGGIGGSLAGR
jgi:multiple sugar transport system permease protein